MRKILQSIQYILIFAIVVMLYMLLFHNFGATPQLALAAKNRVTAASSAPTLEQLRTWSDLIVQKTIFSANRGNSVAATTTVTWAKEGPAFQLVGIFELDGKRGAMFLPTGSDASTYHSTPLYVGGTLADKVTIKEIKDSSVVVEKSDGLYEMKLSRASFEDKVTISTIE